MKDYLKNVLLIFTLAFLAACSGSAEKKYVQNPVDGLIKSLDKEKTFSIVLYDMDFDDNQYRHKYKVIKNLTDSTKKKEEITEWKEVDQEFFVRNEDNLGLELASKGEDGKISKIPAPPGYSNYVGNKQYGQWRTDNSGNSFWEFYGKYAFMSSMFNLMTAPVYRSSYYDYRDNYMGRSPYYGQRINGRYQYGTSGSLTTRTNPDFHSRNTGGSSSFKSKLRSRVAQSNSSTTRSTSRYGSGSNSSSSSSSSSSRSRSGSYGK
ncbi:MAG: hypothetical protein EAZ55_04080 [Cytophagales bacterium]|nr:MAG: hypothetical protein EAZ55_04080 [Cytophagales bacterium]